MAGARGRRVGPQDRRRGHRALMRKMAQSRTPSGGSVEPRSPWGGGASLLRLPAEAVPFVFSAGWRLPALAGFLLSWIRVMGVMPWRLAAMGGPAPRVLCFFADALDAQAPVSWTTR